jgi:aminopeptidase YwaD
MLLNPVRLAFLFLLIKNRLADYDNRRFGRWIMKLRIKYFSAVAAIFLAPLFAAAQMTPWFQWTFLPQGQMDQIIGEASGETAFSHIMAMGGVPRNRKPVEYAGTFMEAQYILNLLKEYGLSDAAIIRFPGGETWDGERGELWEVKPGIQKIASYIDLRAMLATGSSSADVTAELVWVGEGELKDFEGLDVKGKIVVTSGSAAAVHSIACLQKGAEGVVSFASPRPLFDPLLIPWSGISGSKDIPAKFAFYLPPREGALLRDRLRRGEKITVHATVESSTQKYELQDVVTTIPGVDPGGDEIILSAHLFEGYAMQGANDNYSGSAAILETARTLQTLIQDGRLPRPKRTIRFLWAHEVNGTVPYVQANKELMRRTLCNINLDMVGVQLTKSLAFFTVMRTTYGNPHYINDVMENYYRYVGETNRSYVTNGMSGNLQKRIVAPSGSEEPMYYYIGTHFGSSDHEVFNDWGVGVPGVVMNTWPDRWLHTSQDRPDKIDPTQMKRAVVIAAAAAYTIAAADDKMAGQIAAEIVSNALARIAHQLARGLEELKRADKEQFAAIFRKVCSYVEAAAINERATLDSVKQLVADKANFGKYLDGLRASVTGIEQVGLKTLDSSMRMTASCLGIKPSVLTLSAVEKKAAAIIPKPTPKIKENGYQGYQTLIQSAMSQTGGAAPDQSLMHVATEIQLLCDGRNSAFDIKKMVDTQFRQETDLGAILAHLEVLKKAGLITF